MTNFEFWQQAFLACLTAGRPVAEARDMADEALLMMATRPALGSTPWVGDRPDTVPPALERVK